jgi:hypothetical protein
MSVLQSTQVADRLGWSRYVPQTPFRPPPAIPNGFYEGDKYFDLTQALWDQNGQSGYFDRDSGDYERNQMPGVYRGTSGTLPIDIVGWLMSGAIREDDLPPGSYRRESPPDGDPYGSTYRVFNHFYDPVGDRPLDPPLPCSVLPSNLGQCFRATDWAIGAVGVANLGNTTQPAADPNRRNHFSWADAREAMWCGLTYRKSTVSRQRDAATRRLCWATALKSVGNVLHLLQDAAQPQHVRNDRHNPPDEEDIGGTLGDPFSTTMARRTYEIFTNWRATGGEVSSGLAEERLFRSIFVEEFGVVPPPLILANSYPIPRFTQPTDYLTSRARTSDNSLGSINSRRGMADFTNRNFFSEGTLFSGDFPSPPSSPSDPGWVVVESAPKPHPLGGVVREREFRWQPTDSVNPGFVDPALAATSGRIPIARDDLWRSFSAALPRHLHPVPLEFIQLHADVLLPRATAYSAGLIDFFFRGTLDVLEPATAVLATLDQGTPHTVDSDGYPRRTSNNTIFGFTSLRLRVKNTTPAITESGTGRNVSQLASNGKVVAVARYHRNLCYQPDLTGELTNVQPSGFIFVPSGCAPSNLRTNYEELSVSAPVTITNQIDQSQAAGFTFDFANDPIPINATDLRVQVVYRGVLGEERDGIAVGLLDVPETFWVAGLNMTDFFAEDSEWFPSDPGGPPDERPAEANVLSGTWRDAHGQPATGNLLYGINGVLPSARLVRIAVIGRMGTGQLVTTLQFVNPPPPDPPYIQPAPIPSIPISMNVARQFSAEVAPANQYSPTPVLGVRGIGFDRLDYFFLSTDGSFGPDIAELPQLGNVVPVPNIVVLAPLPPPAAEPLGEQYATTPQSGDTHGGIGMGYDPEAAHRNK